MNFKPIPNKFEYLNWQEIEVLQKQKINSDLAIRCC